VLKYLIVKQRESMKYLLTLIVIFSSIFLTGCSKIDQEKNNINEIKSNNKGITAIKAWEKVKPEAHKWSQNYKIASISDVSVASIQRIDGLSAGWKFYLEDCSEYFTGSMSNNCKTGKSRNFYFYTEKMAGGKIGIIADTETNIPSGRSTFEAEKLKIDSDKAQELGRKAIGKKRNENEEFVMKAYSKGGINYWQVKRQCWIKGDRSNCDSGSGYSVYVNIKTGEIYEKEPKN